MNKPLLTSSLTRFGLAFVLAICVLPMSAQAQDDKKDEKKPPTVSSLKTKLRKEISRLGKEYRAADSEDEKEVVATERREFEKSIIDQVIEITNERDNASLNLRDLAYFVPRIKGDAQQAILDLVMKQYIDESDAYRIARDLARSPKPTEQTENFLRSLLDKSENERVKAEATLRLAQVLTKFSASDSGDRDEEELSKEIEKLLDSCVNEFGDIKSVASEATGLLNASKLKIGKIAPDIVGVDLDDKEFKLSDYRGKVVVIDFWGDW
jgi:hypothetical protein